MKDFLVNRDETGREIVYFPKTGKKYYVEYIGSNHVKWGDVDPATNKITGSYGIKYTGSIRPEESLITKENGFRNIRMGKGSPYQTIMQMHEDSLVAKG